MKSKSKFNKIYKSIVEVIDDKLKEDVYKLFKLDNFKKSITLTTDQPSIIATKHVADNLKNYDVYPCEGTMNDYKYYFPVVTIGSEEFVVDLGNNLNGNIIPIVEPLYGSKYNIKKKFSKSEFLKQYQKLSKDYNNL